MVKAKKICPQALLGLSCNNPSCIHRHDVASCDVCSLVFSSAGAYKEHVKTKKHRSKVTGSATILHCPICRVYVPGLTNWDQHVQGSRHCFAATDTGVDPNIDPEEPEMIPGRQLCPTCNTHISARLWPTHSATPQHKEKEKFASYKSAVEEAENDKHGVSVSGDFDFGVIEVAAARAGERFTSLLQTSIPSSKITLVEAKLASKKGKITTSPFTVSVDGLNRTLTSRTSIGLSVAVRQAHAGRSEDRLDIVFEDVQLKTRFMIARTLRVVVGSKADHELLKPKSPYVPRKPSARQPVTKVVEGVAPPALSAIPYRDALPRADIPKLLKAALSNGSFAQILRQMRQVYLPSTLESATYSRHFKHLLWIEEFRMESDLEHYDITNASLDAHNHLFYLDVPGLAEKRPSVLVGDRILVHRNGSTNGHWYCGHVHVVRREEVGLRFHSSFKSLGTDRFHVRFKLNRYPMRRQHLAMDTAFAQDRVLFPTRAHLPGGTYQYPLAKDVKLKVFNPLIAQNPPQLQAVTSIAQRAPGSVPFVIFGPPGTGKTVTMVEAIRQVLKRNPASRVFATAPSNSAADLIASRLTALGKDALFRAYAPSRHKGDVPSELQDFSFANANGHFSVPDMAKMLQYRVVVTTCVSASMLSGIGIPRGHYSHIFIDEAGQATEPEAMIAIKTMADNATNIILSGDPKQLGPIIRSSIARELCLEISYIERLMKREIYDETTGYGTSVVKLVKNFRSHKAILQFPNERFYKGELEPRGDPKVINSYLNSKHLASSQFPIVFQSVSGKDDREASSPSFFNIDEVTLVKNVIESLRADRQFRITDNDIGVIAPYHAQCLKIRAVLRAVFGGVKVGSVEEFQGQERRVIIISTVRSSREFVEYDLKHTLGFVANPRRFNVAVTRAQALLIVIGDPSVLSLDPLWRSFLNYVHVGGGWKGPPPNWDTHAAVDDEGGYDVGVRRAAQEDMNDFTRAMEAMTLNSLEQGQDEDDGVDVNVDRPWNDME